MRGRKRCLAVPCAFEFQRFGPSDGDESENFLVEFQRSFYTPANQRDVIERGQGQYASVRSFHISLLSFLSLPLITSFYSSRNQSREQIERDAERENIYKGSGRRTLRAYR